MEKTQVKVEFYITSKELSVSEMVNLLKCEGDFSGDKNDVLKNGCLRGESFIEFSTEYEDSLDICEQYNKVLVRIESIKKNILPVLEEGKVWCHVCIVIKVENGDTPAMIINNQFINLLNEMRAEIEFDMYVNSY